MDLSYLMKLSRFAGLFFASSATFVDGGAGVGDGGDGGGAGDDGAGGGDDGATGDEGDVADDTGDIADTGNEADTEETDDGADGGEKAKVSAKATPDAIKKALNKMRESDPEGLALLRKTFFKQEQDLNSFRSAFKTPVEAAEARDLFETYGGSEGIQKLKGEADTFAQELSLMAKGDPAIIEELARDFPDGLVKLAPAAIDKLREVNPQAYERFSGKIIASTLRDKGVTNAVARIMELIDDGKQGAALAKTKELQEWMSRVEALASSKPADEPDSREKEYREKEERLNQEKQGLFRQQLGTQSKAQLSKQIDKYTAPHLKGVKLNSQQLASYREGVESRISGMLLAKKDYRERIKQLQGEGDMQKILRYYGQQVEQVAARAARDEWASRGFAGTAKKANGNGSVPRGTSVSTAGSKPNPNDIDWSKDRNRMRYTGNGEFGEATLKNGKVVKFRH